MPTANARESSPSPTRDVALDRLRGFVIVLMALDHVRDFVGDQRIDPMDVEHAPWALFATRWITHLCAPGFVFLAGLSAHLYMRSNGATRARRFLITRGIWLIVLELTVVHFAWYWQLDSIWNRLMVLWAIGGSMIALAPFARAPRWLTAGVGATIVLGHDFFDRVHASELGRLGFLWTLLHEPGRILLPGGFRLGVLYPLLPWTGLMLLGFAFGAHYGDGLRRPARAFARGGVMMLALFAVVRCMGFGDPERWHSGADVRRSAMSFLNVEKYPPSLCYMLATIGILALVFACLVGRDAVSKNEPLLVFGRVPMFFYVVHLFAIHATVRVAHALVHAVPSASGEPPPFDLELRYVYLGWAVVLGVLYPACVWFGRIKARRAAWWLTYL